MSEQSQTRDLASSIGKHARSARISQGWTQEETATKVGVSVEFYSRIERGRSLPGLTTLVCMAKVLNTGLDRLVGLSP